MVQSLCVELWSNVSKTTNPEEFKSYLPNFIHEYNKRLLWKHQKVDVFDKEPDGDSGERNGSVTGILFGLNQRGNLEIETENRNILEIK